MPDPQGEATPKPAVEEHLRWVERECVPGTRGDSTKPFLPASSLKARFSENNYSRLKSLLQETHVEESLAPTIANRFPAVFAILLQTEQAKFASFITHFIFENLSDEKLPFTSEHERFPKAHKFFDQFKREQWKYCAQPLRRGQCRYDEDEILPFARDADPIKQGSSARVYKIETYGGYDELDCPRPKVLKTYYTPEAKKDHDIETSALSLLQRHGCPAVIEFCGSFQHGDSYHSILEYADGGTLEDFFHGSEPRTPEDILAFYESLLQLCTALMFIHGVKKGQNQRGVIWHQDIKPDNILVVSGGTSSRFHCKFKLADFGASHFKAVDDLSTPVDNDSHGGKTYGAPECYRPDSFIERMPLPVAPKVDVWSLGAVFSEAVAWVVLTTEGLDQYREHRRVETSKIDGFKDDDCFHNGEERLATVEEMLERAKTSARGNDPITSDVVELTDLMLQAGERPTAKLLHERCQRILRKARHRLQGPEITRALTAPEQPHGPPPMAPPFHLQRNSVSSPPPGPASASKQRNTVLSDSHTRDIRKSHEPFQHGGPIRFKEGHTHGNPPWLYNNRLSDRENDLPEPLSYAAGSSANDRVYDPHHNPPQFGSHPWATDSQGFHRGYADATNATIGLSSQAPLVAYHSMMTTQASQSSATSGYTRPLPVAHQRKPKQEYHLVSPWSAPNVLSSTEVAKDDVFIAQPSEQAQLIHQKNPRIEVPSDQEANLPTISDPSKRGERAGRTGLSMHEGSDQAKDSNSSKNRALENPTRLRYLSVLEAEKWYQKMKRESSSILRSPTSARNGRSLEESDLVNELRGMNHVFLIDDAVSMKPHWPNVKTLFGPLAYLIKQERLDEDGLDLRFTINTKSLSGQKKTTPLINLVSNTVPSKVESDLPKQLDKLLSEYKRKLNRFGLAKTLLGPTRGLQIYVFTDGVWQAESYDAAEKSIRSLIQALDENNQPQKNVGIQFIRFGNDKEGKRRLERLDRLGKDDPTVSRDIVDTEPFEGGNVWKMMLGATNDTYDDDPKKV
ncbi:kinase-like protein [Rhizodiscina lignyota]|uniref:Kinase-like protein n=1 Tax=Rhizodiscina lignyota TaxID=1504668 RepID=A0A9P4MAG5_9PEZI|nr:kinase-like protein [Rhizodiscina lignyota]